ncbi:MULTISPECIES: hypothetical protein [Microbacterium]|uniref:hypothetical protein n=1 Tax=Microbacterium TaxID=33882 RepID=UPI0010F52EB5|nr:hypothetical protein [Microbacterium sp. 4NA327F11]MCK9917013.1 hypothetical protein [Microbacteriaceae bacterium K1510]
MMTDDSSARRRIRIGWIGSLVFALMCVALGTWSLATGGGLIGGAQLALGAIWLVLAVIRGGALSRGRAPQAPH